MSKINFEEDVANIDQTGLESVAELLSEQLRIETVIEDTEAPLKDYKEQHVNYLVRLYQVKWQN